MPLAFRVPGTGLRAHRKVAKMSENQPEIFANTHDLLRGLQSEDAQTARKREQALGDVDQIGPEQIEEWIPWASDSGFGDPNGGRYNITARGQGIIGLPDYASCHSGPPTQASIWCPRAKPARRAVAAMS
jgi:hypothetical protein